MDAGIRLGADGARDSLSYGVEVAGIPAQKEGGSMDQRLLTPPRSDVPVVITGTRAAGVHIPQYSKRAILAVWAAAALPMGALAWIVSPMLAHSLGGAHALTRALIICLTLGLVWQFVLVAVLVRREQGTLRWGTVRDALWLSSPRSPKRGRTGGRVWLVVIPMIVLLAAEELIPGLPRPVGRDLGLFLQSNGGQAFMHGAWGWFALLVVMFVFNTVLGEELLFRGFLLPRMNGAFGKRDWVANGVLFAVYHLHVPWAIPPALLDTFALAGPAKRYRSAWVSIAAHSAQSVFFTIALLGLVART